MLLPFFVDIVFPTTYKCLYHLTNQSRHLLPLGCFSRSPLIKISPIQSCFLGHHYGPRSLRMEPSLQWIMRDKLKTLPTTACFLRPFLVPSVLVQQQNPKSSLDVYKFKEKTSPYNQELPSYYQTLVLINCLSSQKQTEVFY